MKSVAQVLLVYTEDGNLSADTCRCRETVKCAMRASNKFQKVLVLLYLHFGVALSFGKYFAWKMSAKTHKKIAAVATVRLPKQSQESFLCNIYLFTISRSLSIIQSGIANLSQQVIVTRWLLTGLETCVTRARVKQVQVSPLCMLLHLLLTH